MNTRSIRRVAGLVIASAAVTLAGAVGAMPQAAAECTDTDVNGASPFRARQRRFPTPAPTTTSPSKRYLSPAGTDGGVRAGAESNRLTREDPPIKRQTGSRRIRAARRSGHVLPAGAGAGHTRYRPPEPDNTTGRRAPQPRRRSRNEVSPALVATCAGASRAFRRSLAPWPTSGEAHAARGGGRRWARRNGCRAGELASMASSVCRYPPRHATPYSITEILVRIHRRGAPSA